MQAPDARAFARFRRERQIASKTGIQAAAGHCFGVASRRYLDGSAAGRAMMLDEKGRACRQVRRR
jgi:hypothetical protein